MEASLWNIQDDVINNHKQIPTRKQEIEVHIDLVLQSLSMDICGEDEGEDSLQILKRAFSKFQAISSNENNVYASTDEPVYNRHTRSLGSAQSRAFMQRSGTDESLLGGNKDTLSLEADVLERMWDEAMAEERTVIETDEV